MGPLVDGSYAKCMERLPFEVVAIVLHYVQEYDEEESYYSSCCLLYASKGYSRVIAPHLYNNPISIRKRGSPSIAPLLTTSSEPLKWSKLFRTLFLSAEGRTSLPYVKYIDILPLSSIMRYFEIFRASRMAMATFVDAVDFEGLSKSTNQFKKLIEYANDSRSLTDPEIMDTAQIVVLTVAVAATNATKVATKILTRNLLPLLYHTQELSLSDLKHVEETRWPDDLHIPWLSLGVYDSKICQAATAFIAALSPNTLEKFVSFGKLPECAALFTIISKHRLSLRSLRLNRQLEDAVSNKVAASPEFTCTCLEECMFSLEARQVKTQAEGLNYFLAASHILKNAPNLRQLELSVHMGAKIPPLGPLISSLKLKHLHINVDTMEQETLDALKYQAHSLMQLTLVELNQRSEITHRPYFPLADLSIDKHSWGLNAIPLYNFMHLTHLHLRLDINNECIATSMLATLVKLEFLVLDCSMTTITTEALDTLSALHKLKEFRCTGELICRADDIHRFVCSIITLYTLELAGNWTAFDQRVIRDIEDILKNRGGRLGKAVFKFSSSDSESDAFDHSDDDSGSMNLDFSGDDSINGFGEWNTDEEEWNTDDKLME